MSEKQIGAIQIGLQYTISHSTEIKNEDGSVVNCAPETTIRIERFTRGTLGSQSVDEITESIELSRQEFEHLVSEVLKTGWKAT